MLSLIILMGIFVGWIRKGRITNLLLISDFRGVPLFGVAVLMFYVTNTASFGLSESVASLVYICSFLFLLLGQITNLSIPGIWMTLLGTGLNFFVILFNEFKMPVSTSVLNWITAAEFEGSYLGLTHSLANFNTKFTILTDIIVVPPKLPFSGVYSVGDLLLYLGAIILISSLMVGKVKG